MLFILALCLAVLHGDSTASDASWSESDPGTCLLQTGTVRQTRIKDAKKDLDIPHSPSKIADQQQNPLTGKRTQAVDKSVENTVIEEQAPCIVVLAFDRPASLDRLLTQLNKVDFGSDSGRVRLTMSIDHPKTDASTKVLEQQRRTISVAKNFTFAHGEALVQEQPRHAGLVKQWVDAWKPDLDSADSRPACVILEDDVVPSRFAWLWTKNALAAYGDQLQRIATFGWQRQTLVPASSSSRGLGHMPPSEIGKPFMSKLMASWGLVALRSHWIGFRRWMVQNYVDGHPAAVLFEGREIQPSVWHRNGPSGVWTYWLIRYMDENRLFTLYANLPAGTTLCANMREPGLHYSGIAASADAPLLQSDTPALSTFPSLEALTWYDWDGKPVPSQVRNSSASTRKILALCTMTTSFTQDVKRLLHSIEVFMPNVTVYVYTTKPTGDDISAAFPRMSFVMNHTLSRYAGMDRESMMRAHLWTSLQMEKAAVLRAALNDGFEGAWFLDADVFLLAPLPNMSQRTLLALSPQLTNAWQAKMYGTFNGGTMFVRDVKVLDDWESIAPTARCAQAQDQVYEKGRGNQGASAVLRKAATGST
eukprot:TRINITY_DN9713_c0_g1_i2.p1 TRINITY_DN9713_c0_g1~~TRINITY_DN9713_c0_g1_i2.p1  ORF type:complete len:591 (-),score=76.10 TRINITY_DN9713_c0_g1_i2:291-2063(-)